MAKAIGPWYLIRSENDARHWDIRLSPETGWRGDEYMSLSGLASAERARIAAAAPELLEALISMRDRLQICAKNGLSASDAYDSFYQEIVEEAIAKATGSQS